MPSVFSYVNVYPQAKDLTLLEWELHPQFKETAPYTFVVQFSRSGSPIGTDWVDIATVVDGYRALYSFSDTIRRNYAVNEEEFYRIKLTTSDSNVYYSNAYPAWGALDRADRLKIREMYRQECLRLRKQVGSNGLLLKRRHWGKISTNPAIIDEDTKEILDPLNSVTFDTHFEGGYYKPIEYWVEYLPNTLKKIRITEPTTSDTKIETVKGLAWPAPRSMDIWVNCTTAVRYQVEDATIMTRIRHMAVTYTLRLRELPTTDIAYDIPLE